MPVQFLKVPLTTALVICAVVVTALVVRRELFLNRQQIAVQSPDYVLNDSLWKRVSAYETTYGPRSARARVVEFFDYECPYCKHLHPVLDSIRARYPQDVSLTYRHFPLDYHPAADRAAIAAECAGEQGLFKAYHDILFENQAQLSNSTMSWTALAHDAGVPNMERFQTCVTDERTRHKVDADAVLAGVLGIDGIPTLIVNGSMYSGFMSVSDLDTIVQKALKDAD